MAEPKSEKEMVASNPAPKSEGTTAPCHMDTSMTRSKWTQKYLGHSECGIAKLPDIVNIRKFVGGLQKRTVSWEVLVEDANGFQSWKPQDEQLSETLEQCYQIGLADSTGEVHRCFSMPYFEKVGDEEPVKKWDYIYNVRPGCMYQLNGLTLVARQMRRCETRFLNTFGSDLTAEPTVMPSDAKRSKPTPMET